MLYKVVLVDADAMRYLWAWSMPYDDGLEATAVADMMASRLGCTAEVEEISGDIGDVAEALFL